MRSRALVVRRAERGARRRAPAAERRQRCAGSTDRRRRTPTPTARRSSPTPQHRGRDVRAQPVSRADLVGEAGAAVRLAGDRIGRRVRRRRRSSTSATTPRRPQFTTVYGKTGTTRSPAVLRRRRGVADVHADDHDDGRRAHLRRDHLSGRAGQSQAAGPHALAADVGTIPTFTGVILSEGELVVDARRRDEPGQTITLLGVADRAVFTGPVLTQHLNGNGPLVGIIGTTYTFQYASTIVERVAGGYQIVQPGNYDNGPVTIAETDGGNIVTMTAISQTTPPAAAGRSRSTSPAQPTAPRRSPPVGEEQAEHGVRVGSDVLGRATTRRRRSERRRCNACRTPRRSPSPSSSRCATMTRTTLLAALCAALALAACGGGRRRATPPAAPQYRRCAARSRPFPMTISIPRARRRPRHARRSSSRRASAAIAIYDGATLIYVANLRSTARPRSRRSTRSRAARPSRSGRARSRAAPRPATLTVTSTIGAHKFDVIIYPANQGTQAQLGSARCRTPGRRRRSTASSPRKASSRSRSARARTRRRRSRCSASPTRSSSRASPRPRTTRSTTFGYRLEDSTNAQIVQPGNAYDNGPITITAAPSGIVTIAPTSISTPPATVGDQNFTVTCVNAAGGAVTISFGAKTHPDHGVRVGADLLDAQLLGCGDRRRSRSPAIRDRDDSDHGTVKKRT